MIFYNAHDLESQLLKLVLDIKEVEYTTETVATECAISDRDTKSFLLLDDIFTAIKYLNDRYPKPNLFSDSPEQTARLNMFLVKTLKAYKSNHLTEIISELEQLPLNSNFITGDLITIADLALYPILPDNQRWKAYKQKITESLDTKQKN